MYVAELFNIKVMAIFDLSNNSGVCKLCINSIFHCGEIVCQVALDKRNGQKCKTKQNDPDITLESTYITIWNKTDDF